MSQIIALISAKGGAGKTGIAVNLAHACAVAGLKVLVIDCDINTNGATAFYRQKEDVRRQLNNCITFQEILYNVLYPEIYKIDTEKIPVQIASLNGHLCHIWRPACDLNGGQPRTH